MAAAGRAQKHLADAKEALKTGMFKWKPDYLAASIALDKAGSEFRNCRRVDEAVDAWRRSADASNRSGQPKSAANSLQKAADLLAQSVSGRGASPATAEALVELLDTTAGAWMEAGDMGRANQARANAAKHLITSNPKEAERRYLEVAAAYGSVQGSETYATRDLKPALAALVRGRCHASAMRLSRALDEFYEKLKQDHNVFNNILLRSLLLMADGDLVGARAAYEEGFQHDGFLSSDQAAAAEAMVTAAEAADTEALTAAAKGRIRHLDNAIVTVARRIATKPGEAPAIADNQRAHLAFDAPSGAAAGGAGGGAGGDDFGLGGRVIFYGKPGDAGGEEVAAGGADEAKAAADRAALFGVGPAAAVAPGPEPQLQPTVAAGAEFDRELEAARGAEPEPEPAAVEEAEPAGDQEAEPVEPAAEAAQPAVAAGVEPDADQTAVEEAEEEQGGMQSADAEEAAAEVAVAMGEAPAPEGEADEFGLC